MVNPVTESLFQLMPLNKYQNMLAVKHQQCTELVVVNGKRRKDELVKQFAKSLENSFVYTLLVPAHQALLSHQILRGNANLKILFLTSKHQISCQRLMKLSKTWNARTQWTESSVVMWVMEKQKSLSAQHLKRCKMENR